MEEEGREKKREKKEEEKKVRVRRSVPLLRLYQREGGSGADLCGVEVVKRIETAEERTDWYGPGMRCRVRLAPRES